MWKTMLPVISNSWFGFLKAGTEGSPFKENFPPLAFHDNPLHLPKCPSNRVGMKELLGESAVAKNWVWGTRALSLERTLYLVFYYLSLCPIPLCSRGLRTPPERLAGGCCEEIFFHMHYFGSSSLLEVHLTELVFYSLKDGRSCLP